MSPAPSFALAVRRPLLAVALAFVAGVCCGTTSSFPVAVFLVLGIATGLLAILTIRWRLSTAMLLACWAALGAARSKQFLDGAGFLRRGGLSRPQTYMVAATILTSPAKKTERAGVGSFVEFMARLLYVRSDQGWARAAGILSVTVRSSDETQVTRLRYGDIVLMQGLISSEDTLPTWWGPAYRFRVRSEDLVKLEGNLGCIPLAMLYRIGEKWAANLGRGIEGLREESTVIRALLLGDRSEITAELYDDFVTTGTLHIMAVSGVHVGIVAWVAHLMLGVSRVSFRVRHMLVLLAVVAYTVMTGLRVSAVRAMLMTCLWLAGVILYRRADLPTLLAAAALVILGICPGQIFESGFLLSFGAMIALVAVSPALRRSLEDTTQAIEMADVPQLPAIKRVAIRGVRYSKTMLWASCAVWLVTAPLCMQRFGVCAPVGVFGNFVVVPLATSIIWMGILSGLTAPIWPFWAEALNASNAGVAAILLRVVRVIAKIPWGHFRVEYWSYTWTLVWWLLIFLSICGRGVVRLATVWASIVFFFAVGMQLSQLRAASWVIVPEPVESGVVLVRGPRGRAVLVNAGPRHHAERLISSLHRLGISRLDAILLARASADYVDGLSTIVRVLPVTEVWCSPGSSYSPSVMREIKRVGEMGIRIRRVSQGESICCGSMEFEIWSPSGVQRPVPQERHIAFRVTHGAASVSYFPIWDAVGRTVSSLPTDPQSVLMIVGGVGDVGGIQQDALNFIKPRYVLFLPSPELGHRVPADADVRECQAHGAAVYLPDQITHEVRWKLISALQREDDPSVVPYASSRSGEFL